jgi:N utilization substance protein B
VSALGHARRHARERTLEILYESDIKDRPISVVVAELNVKPDGYTLELLNAVENNRERANQLIEEFAIDWPLERIAVVDRLIMTMAIGEMLMDNAPPLAVILDEAVESAKTYSTDGSPSFVNGVLAAIAQKILG